MNSCLIDYFNQYDKVIKKWLQHMIFKKKIEILNWLKEYEHDYQENIDKNAYELIHIHDINNKALFNEMIKKDSLPDDYFDCSSNYLESLKGSPQYVGGDFYCDYNQLMSLKGSPQHINGHFFCHHNQLTSLEYFPEKINVNIFLNNNEKLFKYKNQSDDIYIQNMSDNYFLSQENFLFWKQFHLQEKAIKENIKILDDLKLNDKIEQNNSASSKAKKV